MSVDSYIKPITDRTVIWKTTIDNKLQSNTGAIALGDYLIAIDPSPEAYTAPNFRKDIEEHFKLPVKYLLVTHYHGDHTRGVEVFKDTIILGSKQLYKKMKNEGKQFLPEIIFQDKLIIKNADSSVEFYYAGGHTACSTYAYFPDEKVIFLGQVIRQVILINGLVSLKKSWMLILIMLFLVTDLYVGKKRFENSLNC